MLKPMTDCIFCKIIRKDLPTEAVFEDEHVLAFMDIRPVAKGHMLVISKQHTPDFLSADSTTVGHVMVAAKRIGQALMKAVNAQGMNISTNNGAAAGQAVFHLHFHLIPRFNQDDLVPWPHHDVQPATRAEIAEQVRKQL